MEALADTSVKSTDVKTEQQLYTAASHFNAFLRSHGDLSVSSSTMHSIGHACITAELMGRFGTYLFMNAKKLNATHSYMSQAILCAQMARVGPVVAGWLDSDHGGILPSPATIPSKDRPLFRALTPELFKSYLNIYERAMLDVLAASLIMRYSAVIASWETTCGVGESLAASTMNAGLVRVSGETSTLVEWSKWFMSSGY